jgi:monoamine oxidase
VTRTTDVLILGAGIAGLQAARDLSATGLHVTLLEASDRLGGRIHTQHCATYPVELGAEFVHGRPEEIFRLAAEAGLRIAAVEGELVSKNRDRWRQSGELWTEVNQLLESMPSHEPDQSFQKYIEGAEASEEAKLHALGFVEGFHAADPEKVSVHWLIRATKAEEEIDGERSFRLVDGYQNLVRALTDRIDRSRCSIHLQAPVTEVLWDPGQVSVRAGTAEFRAARAVIAIPLSVLKSGRLRFLPKLEEKEAAMNLLETGPVIRVSLCFRQKFWETRTYLRDASFLFTDDPDFPTWWTSNPLPYPILTGWAAGRHATAVAVHSEAGTVERALESLKRILEISREELGQVMETAFVHDWQADPFSRGAYSYAVAGGADAARTLAAPVAQTLFFAGEATNFGGHNGTVHGAMASGFRAAQEVAMFAGGELSSPG